MIGQTQKSLISPVCDDKHFKAAAHFRFECETLKINLSAFFFNFQNRTVTSSGNELSLKIAMPCHR